MCLRKCGSCCTRLINSSRRELFRGTMRWRIYIPNTYPHCLDQGSGSLWQSAAFTSEACTKPIGCGLVRYQNARFREVGMRKSIASTMFPNWLRSVLLPWVCIAVFFFRTTRNIHHTIRMDDRQPLCTGLLTIVCMLPVFFFFFFPSSFFSLFWSGLEKR